MIKYGGNIYKRDSLKFEKERMKIYTKGWRGKQQTGTRKTTNREKQRKKKVICIQGEMVFGVKKKKNRREEGGGGERERENVKC